MISKHTAFNAKFLFPKEVANSFVPIEQFKDLLKTGNSVILGPRGCGKTTLLKMLTREALDVWCSRALDEKYRLYQYRPDFEAVYIPSDSRWTKELNDILENPSFTQTERIFIQRLLVTFSVLREWVVAFDGLLSQQTEIKTKLAEAIVREFKFKNTTASFTDIKNHINGLAAELRGVINLSAVDQIKDLVRNTPPIYCADIINICEIFVNLYEAAVEKTTLHKPSRWALCFDELEIAPKWLQDELITSLRSTDKRFLLKLTWSPILPQEFRTAPQREDDYEPIKLWYSHVSDAQIFCESLATNILHSRIGSASILIENLLGSSIFASDHRDGKKDYERDSNLYRAMLELAEDDPSFKLLLERRNINSTDPYTDDVTLRDTLFRKIKPVVLLRWAFGIEGNKRSRKNPLVYCGKEVLFNMSEGNPRRLNNLLNDLIDSVIKSGDVDKKIPMVPYPVQAKLFSDASNQFLNSLKAVPTKNYVKSAANTTSVYGLVDAIGKNFSIRILDKDFPLDPAGSFTVDENIDEKLEEIIRLALERGAIVYMGDSQNEIATKIRGSTFRLSYMVSPRYRLLMRNYSSVSLGSCLSTSASPDQIQLNLDG